MSAAPDSGRGRAPAAHPPQAPLLVSLGFLLAAAALLLAGVDWYQMHEAERAASALQQQLTALQQTSAQKQVLDSENADIQQSLKALGGRIDDLDSGLADLRRHSEEGRDAWIKAEAASLLVAANEEVQLRADPALAIKALQQADERLRLLSDPRLIAVRQEIARESNALHAVPQADIEGMAVKLTGLAANVDSLPLKRSVPQHYASGGNLNEVAQPQDLSLWGKFKAAVGRLVGDMFTLRRGNMPVEPLLSPKEEFLLRRNLELRLETARSALLDHEGPVFQDSVLAAHAWLNDYFDVHDDAVNAGLRQLDGMQQQSIAPRLPDISASLTLLRELEPPRNTAP